MALLAMGARENLSGPLPHILREIAHVLMTHEMATEACLKKGLESRLGLLRQSTPDQEAVRGQGREGRS